MKNKMTMIVAAVAMLSAGICEARPGGGHHGGGFGGPRPVMHHAPVHHHHHGGSVWGRGGSHFWPGFVGGVVGGALAAPIVSTPVYTTPVVVTPPPVVTPAPVVVSTPVVANQNVWVEGRYIDQVQANGTVVRVWQPGHYETRQIGY